MTVEPVAATLAGDPNDDDGAVIDSFFIETDNPPEIPVQKMVESKVEAPLPTSRFLAGSQTFSTSNTLTPLQIAGYDPDRVSIRIRCYSATAGNHVRVAEERERLGIGLTTPASGLFSRCYSGQILELAGHTGPVFIHAPEVSTTELIVSWEIITK